MEEIHIMDFRRMDARGRVLEHHALFIFKRGGSSDECERMGSDRESAFRQDVDHYPR